MTEPKINPATGHEDGLPNPRPRDEIYRELLASYQVDSNTHLFDLYYKLQFILSDLRPFVEKELAARNRREARVARAARRTKRQLK